MILKYTPEFRRDLRTEKAYYINHDAVQYANEIGKKILSACANLKEYPHYGESAAERFDIDTDMMYFVVGRYMIFYRIEADVIEIVRLFNTQTNILFRMFGIDSTDYESEAYWDE